MGAGVGPLQFLGPLRAFDGAENWYVVFYRLPEGKTFEEVRHQATEQYIQAAGRADAMTVEIRKPGGEQWGVQWLRYTVGHPHEGDLPLDVVISLPHGGQTISRAEVFEADEAAQLFMNYYEIGDLPPGYDLRLVEGYTADGDIVALEDVG